MLPSEWDSFVLTALKVYLESVGCLGHAQLLHKVYISTYRVVG